jgi:hypothetical protein
MKTRRSVLRLAASAPVLTLGLALCFAYLTPANMLWSASAQVTSPVGSYGVLLNRWQSSSSNVTAAFLLVLNFDGAGNISGEYTFVNKVYSVGTGTLTGTDSGNPDGSNTVNLRLDTGATITAAMAVTDGGTGLQLLGTGGSVLQPGEVFSGTGRIQSAQGTMSAGSYGMLLNRWSDAKNGPQGVFGVFNLDGAGNVTGSYTIVSENVGPAPISGTFMGTYSTNPDSTGSITLNLDIGVTVSLAIVVTDGGAGILMLQTGENDGFSQLISGTARMQ